MNSIFHEAKIVFRAALRDTLTNVFRPVHNIKVVLGADKQESVEELLRKEGELEKNQSGIWRKLQ